MGESEQLTERQRDYIQLMLTNRFTDERDQRTLTSHLKRTGKREIAELTKVEASELIGALLNRAVKFVFVCGREVALAREEAHRLDIFGNLDACIHQCPIGIDAADCREYETHEREMYSSRTIQDE